MHYSNTVALYCNGYDISLLSDNTYLNFSVAKVEIKIALETLAGLLLFSSTADSRHIP